MHTLTIDPFAAPAASRPRRRAARRYAGSVSTMTADDRALDIAFARGEAELRVVYEQHGSLVYSLCRRALGDEAAKDATQEVFINAWRKRDQFDPSKGALGAWLVGITKRRIIDQARSEGRHANRRADALDDDRASAEQPAPERVVDRMIAAQLLQKLPSRARDVIELVYVHDLTHREAAERLGLPIGTVKSDVRRGIMKIRSEMEVDDV